MIQNSHTLNTRELEVKMELLRNGEREETDPAFHEFFWACLASEMRRNQQFSAEEITTKIPKNRQLSKKVLARTFSLLFPIYPHVLSTTWNIDQNTVLTELLYATKVGLFEMHWAITCLQCSKNTLFGSNLEKTPTAVQCQSCGTSCAIKSLDQIIVVFRFSSDVLLEQRQTVEPEIRKTSDLPLVSANTLINHRTFHLFRDQVVPHDAQAFDCSFVVLVFTDIVGSTNMYAHLGDREALRLVRQYFDILFLAMASRGRIVKTIGDAIMASFSSCSVALEAVAESIQTLSNTCTNPHTGKPLEMRMGMHCGSSIVISVNGINDYFGQTVNIASRVESHSAPSVCLMSEAVLHDRKARQTFEKIISLPDYEAIPFEKNT